MRVAAWGGADLSALMHHAKTEMAPITEGRIDRVLRCSALDKRVPHGSVSPDFAWKGT